MAENGQLMSLTREELLIVCHGDALAFNEMVNGSSFPPLQADPPSGTVRLLCNSASPEQVTLWRDPYTGDFFSYYCNGTVAQLQ
ncbi:hypothetical protein HaLaN_07324, partial [Haematococcus lacustris]